MGCVIAQLCTCRHIRAHGIQLADGMAVLERTPAVLRAIIAGLPSQRIDATEGPDTWSPYVIAGHLVHGERADWVVRAKIILEQGKQRTFEKFDRFAQFRESEGKSLVQLLDEFEELTVKNLRVVRAWGVTDAQMRLTGVHPAFGEVTLRQLLATWTAHDLGHVVQISRGMAKQYRDAVGPWREYLSVMG